MYSEITRELHQDYLLSSARLALFFTWDWLTKHPDEDFDFVIRKRVDIWRKTKFNPEHIDKVADDSVYPEWMDIVGRMKAFYESTKKENDFQAFENSCMEMLTPVMLERIDRDLVNIYDRVDVAKYQCGSLRYNLSPEKENPQRIGFHIANACYPSSIFDDANYLPACFIVLMKQCETRFGVTEIGTGTWLNSYPRWLELFPAEWIDNMGPCLDDVQGHYGFWGQFITSGKTFNHKLAGKFRKTGTLPFLPRRSWCTIKAMRAHLAGKI